MLDEGESMMQVARDLDPASEFDSRVGAPGADRSGQGKTGLTTEEREEVAQLGRKNRTLKMEPEMPKTAAAFLAKNQS